jgi:hypothetical protein
MIPVLVTQSSFPSRHQQMRVFINVFLLFFHLTLLHCATVRSAFTECIAQLCFIQDRLTYLQYYMYVFCIYTWRLRLEYNGFASRASPPLKNKGFLLKHQRFLVVRFARLAGSFNLKKMSYVHALLAPARRLTLHIFWKIQNQDHPSSICIQSDVVAKQYEAFSVINCKRNIKLHHTDIKMTCELLYFMHTSPLMTLTWCREV